MKPLPVVAQAARPCRHCTTASRLHEVKYFTAPPCRGAIGPAHTKEKGTHPPPPQKGGQQGRRQLNAPVNMAMLTVQHAWVHPPLHLSGHRKKKAFRAAAEACSAATDVAQVPPPPPRRRSKWFVDKQTTDACQQARVYSREPTPPQGHQVVLLVSSSPERTGCEARTTTSDRLM